MKMSQYSSLAIALAMGGFLMSSVPFADAQEVAVHSDAAFGEVAVNLTSTTLLVNPKDEFRHRGVINVDLPAGLDTLRVDVAELVLMVSTVFDTTDPLIFVVAPVTDAGAVSAISAAEDWSRRDAGMNMEYVTVTPLSSNIENREIRLDITPIVDLWQRGVIENRGVVVRTATEGKSKFRWERTGAFGGAHARLEIKYSRL
ncbi:MAG: hypothetical protein Kow0074_03800 [Candidatus Zixiibacteriota bacterium]